MTIELYERPLCGYCLRVRRTLDELDLAYVSHEVPAARHEREEVKARSGQTGVPVLVDPANGIEGMPESSAIVAYLERTYGAESAA